MIGDLCQDGAEVKRRIESAELSRANEGVEGSCALTAGIGAKKQVILSSNRDRPQRPLGGTIIDLQQTIIVSVVFWPPCLGPSEESSSIGGDVVATGEL